MSEFHAVVIGKLGVGKSSLINDLIHDGNNVAPTSDQVEEGCTKGIKAYEGVSQPCGGILMKIFDSEGTFGAKDNLGEVVSTAANQLSGKSLHMMMVCISVKHITRVDLDTMNAMKLASGIVGDNNVDKLLVVWTQAESPELEEKAKKCFDTMVQTAIQVYEHGGSDKKKEQMKALYDLAKHDRFQFCTVSKNNVTRLAPLVAKYAAAQPASMKPEDWARDPDKVDEEMDGFAKFLQIVGKVIGALLKPLLGQFGVLLPG